MRASEITQNEELKRKKVTQENKENSRSKAQKRQSKNFKKETQV